MTTKLSLDEFRTGFTDRNKRITDLENIIIKPDHNNANDDDVTTTTTEENNIADDIRIDVVKVEGENLKPQQEELLKTSVLILIVTHLSNDNVTS